MSEARKYARLRVFAAVGLLALTTSCLERRSEGEGKTGAEKARCTGCHGDASRSGDYLRNSAPPRDLRGASDPSYPGVGSHEIHLKKGETHGAFACTECHIVPERTDAPGHADDDRPAELVFGAIAGTDGRSPHYDPVARTCEGGWCHRDGADAVWTEPRTSSAACGTCHGLPPALPHPQSERCEACHGEVVDAQRHFIAPSLHVDGIVQVRPGACGACHGSGERAAPPLDTHGNRSTTAIGVGAHSAHLAGGSASRPLNCAECHRVPESADEPGHAEGRPARLALSGVAESDGHKPRWNHESASCTDTWCHGPGPGEHAASPSWIAATPLTCTSCHGAPPALPHPQVANCSACHAAIVASDDRTIIDRSRHVDGIVDVDVTPSCTFCHGDENPAPPRDIAGHQDSAFEGVGAHQAHLETGMRARKVPCSECHTVPEDALSPGHVDSALPAELAFSGAATAFGARPVYEAATCSETPCHGAVFPNGHRSGGSTVTPVWTKVDGSQVVCGSCHGLPPPRPHPYPTNCSECHEDVASDNVSFVRPDLHIDGVVTFTLP
jgi:predicted CxxxxCH...CXXCH cytochrome family protein